MGFLSLQFVIFLSIVLVAHRLTAPQYRYVVLFASSCYFYACAGAAWYLAVLLAAAAFTWLGGILIERSGRRPAVYRLFWWGNLAFLAFYKVGDLLPDTLTWSIGGSAWVMFAGVTITNRVVLPVGMSFYIFSTCWYLSDVYRKGLKAEYNPIRYAAFATFFPSILSGPIQKGRELLPMIQRGGAASVASHGLNERCRNADDADVDGGRQCKLRRDAMAAAIDMSHIAIHGFELFLWGMFVKLFVSNRLSPAVAYIFDRPGFYSKAYYLPAAMLFALQLYADFASYSDMAIGAAAMLGYPLRRNFNNPFLSTSLSELWNRWHVSLNEWFLENIYFPLGGSRKGNVRKYLNSMVIFLVSGLWHGQGLHFLFWGFYNGILMLIGQWTTPIRERLPGRVRLTWIRRLLVFLLFSMTFIYFRAGTMEAGNVMTLGILTIRPADLAGFYPQQMFDGSTITMIVSLLLTAVFLVVQYLRREEDGAGARNLARWNQAPAAARVLLLAMMLAVCVIAACGDSAAMNSQFVYYEF